MLDTNRVCIVALNGERIVATHKKKFEILFMAN